MKNLHYVLLLDCYGSLLTEKQRELLDGYYNEDLSLSELAEPRGISRQAVHDSIRRGEHQLEQLEEQMGIAQRLLNCRALFQDILDLSTALPPAQGEDISAAAQKGLALLST